jgi:tRNA(Arg) A34 adenosine deaminase TadA
VIRDPSAFRPAVHVQLPEWVEEAVADASVGSSDEERMRFVASLARQNVERGSGGPFAAAIFERDSATLVSVGLNLVLPLRSSILHAEVVAILMAQARVGSYTLAAPGLPVHELVTSCEPCAMCLGAVVWSGARRLVCGATRDDAQSIDFDEGPVFPESYEYLERRGIEVVRGVARDEARAVLELYARSGGHIYNP